MKKLVPALQAITRTNIGGVYDSLGQLEKALECYEQALSIHEEIGNRPLQATTLNNIGLVYDRLRQPEKALEYYYQALPIREEVGDRAGVATTLNNIGLVHRPPGTSRQSLGFLQPGAIYRRRNRRLVRGKCYTLNLALNHYFRGHLTDAVVALKRVVELDRIMQHSDLENDLELLAQVQAELAAQHNRAT